MRTLDHGRALPLTGFVIGLVLVLVAALLPGGCSKSTSPETEGPDSEAPAISLLEPLAVDRQVLLVDTPVDLVATLKADAPAGYTLESVVLHSVSESGASLGVLATLTDTGDAADADMVAADRIYSGVAHELSYGAPGSLRVAAFLTARNAADATLTLWSERITLPIESTDLVFTRGPIVVPQGLTVGETADLRVLTELMVADTLTIDSVALYRVTNVGDSVNVLAPLADNGNLDNGDEIMGDGNYTTIVHGLLGVVPQTIYLRALVRATSTVSGLSHTRWSVIAELPVRHAPPEGLVNVALAYQDSVERRWLAALGAGTDPETARADLLAWLDAQNYVVDAYLAPDGGSLWAVYNMGFEAGVILTDPAGEPVYGASAANGAAPRRPHRDPATTRRLMSTGAPALPRAAGDRNLGNPNEVDSNLALVYSPFASWLAGLPGGEDPGAAAAALFEAAHCPSFGVRLLQDAEANVDALRELQRYGAVSIFTHSAQLAGGQVALLTGESVNFASCLEYAWDLFDTNPAMCIVRVNGASVFAVKAAFVAKYSPRCPDTVLQIAACDVTANNIWPLALLGSGAGFVTGFDSSVTVEFANAASLAFWSGILESGLRSGPAHAASPQMDPGHRHAAFTAAGNEELAFGSELQNGGFELGTLAAWDVAGDGRVISRLADQVPIDGIAMGIVSTGLGYTLNTGEINQTVCVPADAATLRLHYNYFSEEFLEWCGSQYQDYFQVSVIDAAAAETVIFTIEIDDMCDDVTPAGIQFDQGPLGNDAGVYRTGWRDLALNIAAWAGQTVTLRFKAGDIGDSIYDSAILIDAIGIE